MKKTLKLSPLLAINRFSIALLPTFLLCSTLLLAQPGYAKEGVVDTGPQGEWTLLEGTDYLQRLLVDLEQAEHSIDVLLFVCVVPEDARPDHSVRQLLDRLIQAQQRGLQVRVLLDRPDPDQHGASDLNHNAAEYLRLAGLAVHRDDGSQRIHAKTILIDRQVTYLGSANWTWSAFHRNLEQSIRIRDPQLQAQAQRTFEAAWASSRIQSP